jgi:hypothetical protein
MVTAPAMLSTLFTWNDAAGPVPLLSTSTVGEPLNGFVVWNCAARPVPGMNPRIANPDPFDCPKIAAAELLAFCMKKFEFGPVPF